MTYDPFGNVLSETNPSYGDRYKYTGRELDAETNLQYNRARYYDTVHGRFISQDPLGFAAGDSNLYRYAGNGPTNGTDPSGQDSITTDPGSGYTLPYPPPGEDPEPPPGGDYPPPSVWIPGPVFLPGSCSLSTGPAPGQQSPSGGVASLGTEAAGQAPQNAASTNPQNEMPAAPTGMLTTVAIALLTTAATPPNTEPFDPTGLPDSWSEWIPGIRWLRQHWRGQELDAMQQKMDGDRAIRDTEKNIMTNGNLSVGSMPREFGATDTARQQVPGTIGDMFAHMAVVIGSVVLPGPEDVIMWGVLRGAGMKFFWSGGKRTIGKLERGVWRKITEEEAVALRTEWLAAKAAKGQIHHPISAAIHRALESHPTLRGHYRVRDPRFTAQAIDKAAHVGYQEWHRQLDAEVVEWLGRAENQAATPAQFEGWLRQRYAQPDLQAKFPNGF
jgi:RHS repeat-associated protein